MAAYISFQPNDFYNTTTYSGNNSTQAITGVGFQPDFTWIKCRNNTDVAVLFDSVRGVTKYVSSENNSVETTDAASLTAFDSDGFSCGDTNIVNGGAGRTYASWNWKGGTTSGITTDGSTTITPSSYSFNQTAGCSVLAYTGTGSNAMLAHGLGVAPAMISIKNLEDTTDWKYYHQNLTVADPEDYYQRWNDTSLSVDSNVIWNDTKPDAVNISLGTSTHVNDSGVTYVAYVFAEKQGYSKFGAYTGNGNVDGPFLYTGFRPAFILNKINSGTTNGWYILDNYRQNAFNPVTGVLEGNSTAAEWVGDVADFLSNGIKWTSTDSGVNRDAATYTYSAFAEFPFVSSNSIPGTAR